MNVSAKLGTPPWLRYHCKVMDDRTDFRVRRARVGSNVDFCLRSDELVGNPNIRTRKDIESNLSEATDGESRDPLAIRPAN